MTLLLSRSSRTMTHMLLLLLSAIALNKASSVEAGAGRAHHQREAVVDADGEQQVVYDDEEDGDEDYEYYDLEDYEDYEHVGDCIDTRDKCPEWARRGFCEEDPKYMYQKCPLSCELCEHIEQRDMTLTSNKKQPSNNNENNIPNNNAMRDSRLGTPQRLVKDLDSEIRQRMAEAKKYIDTVVDVEERYLSVRELCENYDPNCALWAVEGECESNAHWMNDNCAPVCFTCETLHVEAACPIDPNEKNAWYEGDLDRMFERIANNTEWVETYNVTVLSRPEYAPGDDANNAKYQLGPWVMTLDDFFTEEEAQAMIDLGAEIGYERSTDVGEMEEDGTFGSIVSKARTSTNAWCNNEKCKDHPVPKALYQRMEMVTKIPVPNYESFQLLRYEPGQFYKVHHDYIDFELDRKQGVRILTIFLYLNEVEEGGETDFPELGLAVTPKRGRAVIWPSVLNEDPDEMDERTEHQAKPVIKGLKYGANVWLHQRGHGGEECDA